MTDDELTHAAAERRAEHGYALDDLDPDDPPVLYDTGETAARFENLEARFSNGQINLNRESDGVSEALVYPLVASGELQIVTETQDDDGAPYGAMSAAVDPDQARDVAAALWQAAEDAEALATDGGTADPRAGASVRTGGDIHVTFGADELATARERLPPDADPIDARHVLADLTGLTEEYRTDDGRDAIAAVLGDTDD